MGQFTGPKGKINRRLGVAVYETAGSVRALERRPTAPGMHPRPRKLSDYGLALLEKQKLKHYYGLGERTLRRLFDDAKANPGNTGGALVVLCERRLDNVIRRAGFTKTRSQARQGLAHGHFLVNGRKVQFAGYLVRPGDVVSVKNRENLVTMYSSLRLEAETIVPHWLSPDEDLLRLTVTALPTPEDCAAPVKIASVVEFMSR